MIDAYSSPNTSTTKNDLKDYICALFWISEQDGLKSNLLVQVSFPPCCQLTLCTGVPRQAHADISPDQSFSKPFNRKLAFARIFVVPCKTAVHTKRVQSLTGNAAPFFPKTIRIALWRTLPKLFLHFFSLLFGGIGLEVVVNPSSGE